MGNKCIVSALFLCNFVACSLYKSASNEKLEGGTGNVAAATMV